MASDSSPPNDQQFHVPEPPPEIPAGVLSEVWSQATQPTRLEGVELAGYFLQRGLQTAVALPASNTITVLTIAVSLFLFSTFLLTLKNTERIISEAGGKLHLTAYLKPEATRAEVDVLTKRLADDRGSVRSIEYTSKERALETFRRDLGPRSGFLIGLDQDNPLPASLDILLQPDVLGVGQVDKIVARISDNAIVDEVVFGSRWVESMQVVIRVFRLFGFISLVVVLAIIIFLISNTIKLVIYSRRDEIAVMQLVGANVGFVRTPFIIAGALQGFVGAVIALVLVLGAHAALDAQLMNSVILGVALPRILFLGPFGVIGVLFLGTIVGATGSLFALGRFLDV